MIRMFSLLLPVLLTLALSNVQGVHPPKPPTIPPVENIEEVDKCTGEKVSYVCPDGWKFYEKAKLCYKPVEPSSNCVSSMALAQSECGKVNGSLYTVSIHNQESSEQQFVAEIVGEADLKGTKNIVIGISDQIGPKESGGKVVWSFLPSYLEGYLTGFLASVVYSEAITKGTCKSARVKRTSPPKPPGKFDSVPCVLTVDAGKKVLSCGRDMPKVANLLCKRPAEPVCEPGWSEQKRVCYKTYSSAPKPVKHDEAEAACVNEKAHLVSVHNEPQQEFVKKLIGCASKTFTDEKKNRGRFYFWAGLKLDYKEQETLSKVSWTDGSPVDFVNPLTGSKGKKPWDGQNPLNEYEVDQTCLLLYGNEIVIAGSKEIAGEWKDAPCDNNAGGKILPIIAVRSHVCEKKGKDGKEGEWWKPHVLPK